MLATAFDTLAAARELKAAGFEPEQAEALAAQLRSAAGADRDDLATKADLHREIGILRSELRWILGFLAALIVAMAARLFGIV